MQRFSTKASSVLEKKIFKGFYHIWAWRPSWSMDHNHFSNFLFPQPKEAPYEIWAKLAQGLQRRSHLKMLTDGRTDRRKVITIAHPEHSSGELIKTTISSAEGFSPNSYYTQTNIENFDRPIKIVSFGSDPKKYLQTANLLKKKATTFSPNHSKTVKCTILNLRK